MPRKAYLLLAAVVAACLPAACLLAGCARQGGQTAPGTSRPASSAAPAAPVPTQGHEPPAPSTTTSGPQAETGHDHAHSHSHDGAGHDACCSAPVERAADAPVFAPPPKTTKLSRGDAQSRQVALTFEGSPVPETTTLLLALLRSHGVKATFFVVGDRLEGNRRYLDAILAEKHLIGNGTMAGKPLGGLSREQMAKQIKPCDDLLEHVVGQLYDAERPQMRLLRPPDGRADQALMSVARSLGYTVVLWSVDGSPRQGEPGDDLAERVCSQARSGSIIRLKDGASATREALPRILTRLQDKGLELVTVDEMLR